MHIAVNQRGEVATTVLRGLTGGLPPTLLTEMISLAVTVSLVRSPLALDRFRLESPFYTIYLLQFEESKS